MPVIAGAKRENEDKSVERDLIAWGKVTRDAKQTFTQKKGLPKVTFCIAYARKEFMNCICIGDTSVARYANGLEAGDYVFVAGTWKKRQYTTSDGEIKDWSELNCDIVLLQPDTPVNSAPVDDTPDAFESAEEAAEQPQENEEDFEVTI